MCLSIKFWTHVERSGKLMPNVCKNMSKWKVYFVHQMRKKGAFIIVHLILLGSVIQSAVFQQESLLAYRKIMSFIIMALAIFVICNKDYDI